MTSGSPASIAGRGKEWSSQREGVVLPHKLRDRGLKGGERGWEKSNFPLRLRNSLRASCAVGEMKTVERKLNYILYAGKH